jgi:hypothetical protein
MTANSTSRVLSAESCTTRCRTSDPTNLWMCAEYFSEVSGRCAHVRDLVLRRLAAVVSGCWGSVPVVFLRRWW